MAKLYTHINWGGAFRIEDDGTLVEIVEAPKAELWQHIYDSGTDWQEGTNVLAGDEDLTIHFKELKN